jgi:hypothetical protein
MHWHDVYGLLGSETTKIIQHKNKTKTKKRRTTGYTSAEHLYM